MRKKWKKYRINRLRSNLGSISVACGNMPAPGLGKSGCKRKFTFVGIASGNLQVFREIGCQKNWFYQNGAERLKMKPKCHPKRPKWSPKGANRDLVACKIASKGPFYMQRCTFHLFKRPNVAHSSFFGPKSAALHVQVLKKVQRCM